MKKIILHTIFFTLIISFSGCKSISKTQKTNFNTKIDSILNSYKIDKAINGNVLVFKNDKKVYEKSFGFSDVLKNSKLTSEFKFGLGSVYKEFPGVAIMQLQEKKLLKLDDKISKYLPQLNNWSNQVSIKNLLQYSSGLPRINWRKHNNITDTNVFNDLIELQKLKFKPGKGYLYSNLNPFLLQKIVEKISGMSFYDYAKSNLFLKANMKNTVLKKEFPLKDRYLMAIPFNSENKEDTFSLRLSLLYFSTTKDIYNWAYHLNTYKLINKKSLEMLSETANVESNNKQSPIGNTIINKGKIIEHSHHGSSGNYEMLVKRLNKEKITVVIMTNKKKKNVHEITNKIISVLKKY